MIWNEILEELSKQITPTYFASFISPLQLQKIENGRCVLVAPSEIIKNHVENRYIGFLKEALFQVKGESFEIVILTDRYTSSFQENLSEKFQSDEPSLNSEYNFESFLVSESNKLAYTAAKSIVENPGKFNPLYIYGPVGVGKTHLMHSIGNAFVKAEPWKTVKYVDSISFLNEFIFTVRQNDRKALESFKIKYQSYNLLLFDDVQFLNGSAEKTQEEFFSLFNFLYERKRQIVIASDRPSFELPLHDRLKSRFVHGIQVDIKAHDLPLRKQLLRSFSEQYALSLRNETLDWLADLCQGDARSMIGVVNDLVLYKKAYNSLVLSEEKVKEIATSRFQSLKRNMAFTADQVIDCVCVHTGQARVDILGKSRLSQFIIARHLCMFLLYDVLSLPKSQIGRIFSVNHTTVIYSIAKIQKLLASDVELKRLEMKIRSEISFQ